MRQLDSSRCFFAGVRRAGVGHYVSRQLSGRSRTRISTPYCRDNALAAVARTYGYRELRLDSSQQSIAKEELCRQLNSDIRVQTACADVIPGGDGAR